MKPEPAPADLHRIPDATIGRHVLDNLLPARRPRISPRAVKRPLSRHAHKSLRAGRRTYKATLSIDTLTIPLRP
jgi:hypothetical protein